MKTLRLLFCFLFYSIICHAQVVQEDFAEDEVFAYKAEFTGGVLFNTVGGIPGGFRFKYAWLRQKKNKQFNNISLDVVNIRHPKEYRVATDSGSGFYIFTKMNYLFVLRPSYSREFLVFRKSSEDGIELKLVVSAGPSLGLVKPYYIIVSTGTGRTETIPYSPDVKKFDRILGSSFFTGFNEMKVVPGLNARMSLEFGISAWDDLVTGVELGFQVETFSKKVVIMPYSVNRQTFTSAFVNFYFGKRY